MKFSRRLQAMPASPIRKMEGLLLDVKKRGLKVYHLNIGQPDIPSPAVMVNWLKKTAIHHLSYQQSAGFPPLLKSLAKYYQKLGATDINEQNILITQGGSEAILWSLLAMGDAGSEVIIFEPFYTNVAGYANMAGVKLVPVSCSIKKNFALPPDRVIKKALTKKTVGIYLCNPNNPTGTFYPPAAVKRLHQFCLRHKLYLICDEVYRDFVYDQTKPFTALNIEEKKQAGRLIIIDSFSKRYSLCGIRVGCLVCRDRDLIKQILKYGQARLSVGELDQQIAAKMDLVKSSYFNKVKNEYRARRETVKNGLAKIPGAIFAEPAGAFYFIAKLPVKNADDFCRWLLTEFNDNGATVMLAPANGFYLTKGLGREEVRIAYVLNKHDLQTALAILKKAVEQWKKFIDKKIFSW